MYIIIGASSFIGVYTIDEFIKQGEEIIVTGRNDKLRDYYDKKGITYINLDLTKKSDFDKLPKNNIKGVILLSALLPANSKVDLDKDENAEDYFNVNTIGTINVLEYCRKNNINRVLSTCSYEDVKSSWGKKVITEEEPRNYEYTGDHAVYVFSKNAANDILEYYNQQHNMKNVWFRFPPVYGVGPHDCLYVNGKLRKSGLKIFIDNAISGKDICVFGNKNLSRDIVYVKDVSHAIYMAIKSENAKGLYNMTSGAPVTLEQQAKIIADVWSNEKNGKSKITYNPDIKNNTTSYVFSIDKAKRDFDFKPKYSDFKDMMEDYKKELDLKNYSEIFKHVL